MMLESLAFRVLLLCACILSILVGQAQPGNKTAKLEEEITNVLSRIEDCDCKTTTAQTYDTLISQADKLLLQYLKMATSLQGDWENRFDNMLHGTGDSINTVVTFSTDACPVGVYTDHLLLTLSFLQHRRPSGNPLATKIHLFKNRSGAYEQLWYITKNKLLLIGGEARAKTGVHHYAVAYKTGLFGIKPLKHIFPDSGSSSVIKEIEAGAFFMRGRYLHGLSARIIGMEVHEEDRDYSTATYPLQYIAVSSGGRKRPYYIELFYKRGKFRLVDFRN